MATRSVYVVRHGEASADGDLTGAGRRQAASLGERLSTVPIDAVFHSPLPRAVQTAAEIAARLPAVAVEVAPELDDAVPYVPDTTGLPSAWRDLLAEYSDVARAEGARLAEQLVARFARPAEAETHQVLVTHNFQAGWLVRHALDAPPGRWMGLNHGNAALTVIEYRDDRPPDLVLFNDMGHLPAQLRWTGFLPRARP